MKIEVWSDYACPFCYIGERRLSKAIESLDVRDEIAIEFRSFELDPYASREVTGTTLDRFAKKYRLSKQEASQQIEGISEMGRQEGLDFRYATTLYTNTFDAHRLTKFAQSKSNELAARLIEKLFDAYFTKNLALADHSVLKKIAAEIGLDASEVDDVLSTDKFSEEVIDDERRAMQYGINAVPHFIIDGKYSLSGAQSTEVIRDALKKIVSPD